MQQDMHTCIYCLRTERTMRQLLMLLENLSTSLLLRTLLRSFAFVDADHGLRCRDQMHYADDRLDEHDREADDANQLEQAKSSDHCEKKKQHKQT